MATAAALAAVIVEQRAVVAKLGRIALGLEQDLALASPDKARCAPLLAHSATLDAAVQACRARIVSEHATLAKLQRLRLGLVADLGDAFAGAEGGADGGDPGAF